MLVRLSFVVLCFALSRAEDTKHTRGHYKYTDPFSLLDHHMSLAMSHDHSLLPHISTPIFWPWTELAKAAAVALDEEESIEQPSVHSDPKKYQIKLNVRRYTPQEIKVKVKNKAVLIEGKRIIVDETTDKRYVGNHFVQRYTLPVGVDPEEITAELKSDGMLIVSAPRHPPPPPPKEREVPIVFEEPPIVEDVRPISTAKPEIVTAEPEPAKPNMVQNKEPETSETKSESTKTNESEDQPSDQKRLKEQLEVNLTEAQRPKEEPPLTEHSLLSETTATSGKIRKKELKEDIKKNETKKSNEIDEIEYVVENNVTGN